MGLNALDNPSVCSLHLALKISRNFTSLRAETIKGWRSRGPRKAAGLRMKDFRMWVVQPEMPEAMAFCSCYHYKV
jgi:hypothetical protein